MPLHTSARYPSQALPAAIAVPLRAAGARGSAPLDPASAAFLFGTPVAHASAHQRPLSSSAVMLAGSSALAHQRPLSSSAVMLASSSALAHQGASAGVSVPKAGAAST